MVRKTWIVLGAVALVSIASVTTFAGEELQESGIRGDNPGAVATAWTVCAIGCDFPSIQAAVDAAGDGDSGSVGAIELSPRIDGSGLANRVTLCHIPPGNPENAHTIEVSQGAASVHLGHGDSMGACPEECDGVPSPVPQTGQTGCWGESGNSIDCTGTGQDGDTQTGVSVNPRFIDNGDGTVTDNLTGLVWLQYASCTGFQTWDTALEQVKNLADGSCFLTDGSVAGDWRLPNVKELQSLIDFGRLSPTLPAGHPLFGVRNAVYWSSTTSTVFSNVAFTVSLGVGSTNFIDKSAGGTVWAVRGGR